MVARSDLLNLLVRLHAFSLVTHLELLMSEIISTRFYDKEDDSLLLLSEGRRAKIYEKLEEFKRRNFNPPLLELTDFCDKRDILKKKFQLGAKFKKNLEEIEELRNKVAHAGNYAGDEAEMLQFIGQLRSAEDWIQELTPRLK
jgi:hypothetical protein